MSDIMLPQVPPAPAKAPVKSATTAEPATESQSEQGFSEVLETHMQPEEGGGETASATPEAAAPPTGQTVAATEGGKPLPPTGNPVSDVLAVVSEATQKAQPAVATAQESTVELPPGIALLFPVDHAPPPATGRPAAQQTQAQGHARPQPVPSTTGIRQDLPEPAQASVAQAVRDALAENTESVLPRPAEGFAAHVRAMTAAQVRGVSVDVALERLVPMPAQPSGVMPQAVQTALPQDTLAGTRPLLPATTLDTPFRQPGWDQALSERVMWVANQKFQGAEIKLNPPQLGPIEVRVQLQHEQAHISFTAQHASVREALEAALPRLREMFNANGFNLVDVNVSQHSFAEQQRHAQERATGAVPTGAGVDGEIDMGVAMQQEHARAVLAARGGIDLFA